MTKGHYAHCEAQGGGIISCLMKQKLSDCQNKWAELLQNSDEGGYK